MGNHLRVCPWQMGSLLTMRLRALVQNPYRFLQLYLEKGMTVSEEPRLDDRSRLQNNGVAVVDSESAPEKGPVCVHPQAYFELPAINY